MMEDDESGNGLSVEVCLLFEGELERSVTVSVSTSDGSAIGELYNYTSTCIVACSS